MVARGSRGRGRLAGDADRSRLAAHALWWRWPAPYVTARTVGSVSRPTYYNRHEHPAEVAALT